MQLHEKGFIHIRKVGSKKIHYSGREKKKRERLEKNEGDGRIEQRKIREQRRLGGPIRLRAPEIK